jgi:hypothetical protein
LDQRRAGRAPGLEAALHCLGAGGVGRGPVNARVARAPVQFTRRSPVQAPEVRRVMVTVSRPRLRLRRRRQDDGGHHPAQAGAAIVRCCRRGPELVGQAVGKAKTLLIRGHPDHCLEETSGAPGREQRRPIDAFKEITRDL